MSDLEPMSGTTDCAGDAAAYLLGALEPHEAEAFRLHMEQCAVCRDEVEALSGVVQALPMAARQYQPPRWLKRRVMRDVRAEPAVARPSRSASRWNAIRQGPRAALAGATAALVAAGGAVTAIELSTGAAATVIQAQVVGIPGSAQLRVTGGRAELVVRHLKPAASGHEYEVWLQTGKTAPVRANVLFDVGASGYADVGIPKPLAHSVSAVMVTQELDGGAPHPTSSPVIVARIA